MIYLTLGSFSYSQISPFPIFLSCLMGYNEAGPYICVCVCFHIKILPGSIKNCGRKSGVKKFPDLKC